MLLEVLAVLTILGHMWMRPSCPPEVLSNQKSFSSPTLKSFASFCFAHVLIGGVDCFSGLWGYCAGLPGESAIFGRKDASEKHCGNGRKVALVR